MNKLEKLLHLYFLIPFLFGISPSTLVATPCRQVLSGTVSAERLVKHLSTQKITRIDDIPSCLPAEFRGNFTLVYQSAGSQPQCSDKTHPRIILFSQDASTIIVLPGDLKREGCDEVDIAGFDQGHVTPTTIKYSNGRWNSTHPQSCARCHGEDFRYIWSGYPYWPGVYGQDDDYIGVKSEAGKSIRDFLNRMDSSARYSHLIFPPSEVGPYSKLPKAGVPTRPNLRLSAALVRLNALRILRKMKESPKYEPIKHKILALLMNCDPTSVSESAIDPEKIHDFMMKDKMIKMQKLREAITDHAVYFGNPRNWFDQQLERQILLSTDTIFVLEKIASMLDLNTSDWLMAPQSSRVKSYSSIDLDGRLRHEMVMAVYKDVTKNNSDLANKIATTNSKFCNSPDENNGAVYRALGFNCESLGQSKDFCQTLR